MVWNTNDEKSKIAKSGGKGPKCSLPLPVVFILPCILISLLYLMFKDSFFSGTSRMQDLIIDQIAIDGSNKTGEWEFFWRLLWLGCFCILGLFLIGRSLFVSKTGNRGSELSSVHTSSWDFSSSFEEVPLLLKCALCFFPPVVQLICYGKVSLYLWLFAFVFSLLIFIFKKDCGKCISLFLFLYFDVQLINLIAAFTIGRYLHSDLLIFAAGAVIFIFALIFYFHFYGIFDKVFFISQLPLPLLLILYLKNSYSYQGQILKLNYPKSYIIFIGILIPALYIGFFLQYYFTRKSRDNAKPFIAIASAISVFLYGSYIPSAFMIPTDMHHYGEQMLPWQQIVSLGNSPYEEYSPVSGLFPMLAGGINRLFFGGRASTFAVSFVMLFILFAILIICMISLHVDGKWTLLFAFLFHSPSIAEPGLSCLYCCCFCFLLSSGTKDVFSISMFSAAF